MTKPIKFETVEIDYAVPKSLEQFCKPWNLKYPRSSNWNKAKRKILFIIDHVPTQNLSAKMLLSSETGDMFMNILEHSFKIAKSWGCKRTRDDYGFMFVSWSYFKTYHLDKVNEQVAHEANVARMRRILKKVAPTHIHFFGEEGAQALFGIDVPHRGWVKKVKFNGLDFRVSTNISVTNEAKSFGHNDDDDDDDDTNESSWFNDDALGVDKSNLLGYACENLARLINGSYPFSLSNIVPQYTLVKTIKMWSTLLKKLQTQPYWAYDLETDNLSAMNNRILTAQFTFPDEPDMCYILPLKHFTAPWTTNQLKIIYFELRDVMAKRFDIEDWKTPYMIGQNLSFDIKVTRTELGIPVVYRRIWDVMGAEHILDENIKSVNTKSVADAEAQSKNKPWALDSILARYENDFYFTAKFSKEHRTTISDVELNKDVLAYMAMDTVGPMHLHLMQKKRAALLENDGQPFQPIFEKLVLGVYNDTIHTQSQMMTTGVQADRAYITEQFARETSGIWKERENLIEELYKMPSVVKANKKLLKQQAMPSNTLFAGSTMDTGGWVFDIDNQDHQRLLFFNILELKPIDETSTGKPSLGKSFKNAYSKEGTNSYHREVEIFKFVGEARKVHGYIKGYYEKLSEPDGETDDRIRASYGFVMVVTGRSNSFSPSFQQVPTHGRYAKIVKRCFVAKRKRVIIKMDYSAHEIGCWCIISNDKVLAVTFKTIWNNWINFRTKPTLQKLIDAIQADAHKLNYNLFTGTPLAQIDPPMRQQSKGITFGAMYGKHVKSMARDLNIAIDIMEKIYDKFFGKFKKAKAYLDTTVRRARNKLYTFNPFGYRRNLFGHLAANKGLAGAMDRRAQNSPIQGFASQLGFIAARLLVTKLDMAFHENGLVGEPTWDPKACKIVVTYPEFNLNAMVHDSTEVESSYELVPLITQAMEHCATSGLMKYCTKMYGLEWPIRPQVDFDIGDTTDKLVGWNFTQDFEPSESKAYKKADEQARKDIDKLKLASGLKTCITKAWESHNKRHPGAVKEKEMQKALEPTKRVRKLLKAFPLDLKPYDM